MYELKQKAEKTKIIFKTLLASCEVYTTSDAVMS